MLIAECTVCPEIYIISTEQEDDGLCPVCSFENEELLTDTMVTIQTFMTTYPIKDSHFV